MFYDQNCYTGEGHRVVMRNIKKRHIILNMEEGPMPVPYPMNPSKWA